MGMTNAEKRAILDGAVDRGFQAIREASAEDMKGEGLARLFTALRDLNLMRNALLEYSGEDNGMPEMEMERKQAPAEDEPEEKSGETEVAVAEEPELDMEPEQAPEGTAPEEPEPKQTFTIYDVRAALASAQLKGVDARGLMRKFGARDLLELPEGRYADVMEAVKQELADAT